MTDPYERGTLAAAVAASTGWADLMRRLGRNVSGGQRRVLQAKVTGHGIDSGHFAKRSPWRTYSDEAIAAAAAASSTLREVALRLGARPATGTLSHIARRMAAAGIDVSHFAGMERGSVELPFSPEELAAATASSDSVRGTARALDLPEDGRSRAALGKALRKHGIDTSHFRNARRAVSEEALRAAVPGSTSYADLVRALGLELNEVNRRRVRRRVTRLGLDVSHFARRPWAGDRTVERKAVAPGALTLRPEGSARVNRARLHSALQEVGVPYACAECGNPGEWSGRPITLQIDHISGDWLDNRRENLRYLCPNCHSLTDTWCRKPRSNPVAPQGRAAVD
ncbi:HNH endonuclease [Streptomyces sp. NPDC091259]|uniref:HNH endonuclease n=1 Tax=Streptomyces sp. NPDC091259 TaxID=3365976 RepID=UPI0037FBD32D